MTLPLLFYRNYVYKINLSNLRSDKKTTILSNTKDKPNFGVADTMVGTDYNNESDVYKEIKKWVWDAGGEGGDNDHLL